MSEETKRNGKKTLDEEDLCKVVSRIFISVSYLNPVGLLVIVQSDKVADLLERYATHFVISFLDEPDIHFFP